MESTKSYTRLLRLGFIPEQIERLRRLRSAHMRSKQMQTIAEQRRLEFVRWLVATGRLTDGFPAVTAPLTPGTEQ